MKYVGPVAPITFPLSWPSEWQGVVNESGSVSADNQDSNPFDFEGIILATISLEDDLKDSSLSDTDFLDTVFAEAESEISDQDMYLFTITLEYGSDDTYAQLKIKEGLVDVYYRSFVSEIPILGYSSVGFAAIAKAGDQAVLFAIVKLFINSPEGMSDDQSEIVEDVSCPHC